MVSLYPLMILYAFFIAFPHLPYSVVPYILLIIFVTLLWTFSHFNVLFLSWGSQNCTENSRFKQAMNLYDIRMFSDLFSNPFLIIPQFLFVFLTAAKQWDDVFMELSIIYCFKSIFFVVFHLPFYCLDMLSCKVLLPSFIVCPHPYHLEYLQIIRKLCHWTAQPLFQLIYGYVEQYGCQHRHLAEHLWWLLAIARTDHLLLTSVCSLLVNYLSVQDLPSLLTAWVQAHRYTFISLMLWWNAWLLVTKM